MLLAYQPEFLTFAALGGILVVVVVPCLRAFDATRPHTFLIIAGLLVVTLIAAGLLNYRHGAEPWDDHEPDESNGKS